MDLHLNNEVLSNFDFIFVILFEIPSYIVKTVVLEIYMYVFLQESFKDLLCIFSQ